MVRFTILLFVAMMVSFPRDVSGSFVESQAALAFTGFRLKKVKSNMKELGCNKPTLSLSQRASPFIVLIRWQEAYITCLHEAPSKCRDANTC